MRGRGHRHFPRGGAPTEHPTREGKVYCCAVMDTFSRRIVGWSIDTAQDSALVVNALDMAIRNRNHPPAASSTPTTEFSEPLSVAVL